MDHCEQETGRFDSGKLLAAIREKLNGTVLPERVIPKIFVSDDPNPETAHEACDLGFFPCSPETEGQAGGEGADGCLLVVYRTREDGRVKEEKVGVLKTSQIPSFVRELAGTIRYTNLSCSQWLNQHEDGFGKLVREYL